MDLNSQFHSVIFAAIDIGQSATSQLSLLIFWHWAFIFNSFFSLRQVSGYRTVAGFILTDLLSIYNDNNDSNPPPNLTWDKKALKDDF